jgi:hypothetical protein
MKKIIVALLFAGSFAAEAQELVWETMSLRQWQFQMKPRNRYCYFLRVAMVRMVYSFAKRGFKTPEFAT